MRSIHNSHRLGSEKMRAVLKTLKNEPCCSRELLENEKESFSHYDFLQRYYPALDEFTIPDTIISSKNLELPTKYIIQQWIDQDKDCPKIWNALRSVRSIPIESDLSESEPSDVPDLEPCEVFTKIVHLLNPIDMIREKYVCPEHPLLPQSESTWKNTLFKLHSVNNQAYVDAVANFVLSRFRELDLTPHCVLSYGAYTGISKSYQYNITSEYESFRQCRWFWKGMKSHSAQIKILCDTEDASLKPSYEELYKEIMTCPFDKEEDEDLEPLDEELNADVKSVESYTFEEIEENIENTKDIFHINRKVTHNSPYLTSLENTEESLNELKLDDIGTLATDHKSESDLSESESESESDLSESDSDLNICLEIPNMPIIIINQEAQEGVMDDLLNTDEIDGFERDSTGWEARWSAWIFQIISVLSFLQKVICFTHNDLHSNNIIWRKTDKKYLFYKTKEGDVWRVPTYGKIFSLIDFGRSIFRLGKRLWVSDDHWPDQDASDQYNFGPFFDHNKPKCMPNPSFDLCRLSVSLIDGLFDKPPPKKRGKHIPILSKQGSWIIYETKSPLYNLLWSWTVDDSGQTVFENKDGSDRYDGFELYIHIAQDVHHAVPREQLHRPIFQSFLWKQVIPDTETVYPLDV